MNLKLYIILTAALLAVVVPAAADNSTATVHGAVYSWDTLEPLDNTVIYVNSTPTQYIVAKAGQYSVELVPGNYTIAAKYYQNEVLTYSIEETIEIKDEGNYVLDLLLPPVYSEETTGSPNATKQSRLYSSIVNYPLIALTLLLLFVGGYRLSRKHKQIEKNTFQEGKKKYMIRDFFKRLNIPKASVNVLDKSMDLEKEEPAESKEEYPAPETELMELGSEENNHNNSLEEPAYNSTIEALALKKKLLLSEDLQEVLKIIRSQGGQITQKDLRNRLQHSEVKVSLMLADLEKRKRVKKFKRGRENIVVLIDEKS